MARKSRKTNPVQHEKIESVVKSDSVRVYQTALYVRISVENERNIEADTIGTQIQMLKDFVSQFPELKIYDVYCDDDITGTTFIRPEFSRMMMDVRDHNVNCIVVKDLSRLGRNYLESGEYIEKVFPFFGVRFIAITDRIDTYERPVDISSQIKNMANEMYAKDISRKICSTMKTLQEQGKFIGSQPPYGYLRNPQDKYSLIVDPDTSSVVKELFKRFLNGYTIRAIALDFNKRGIPSPGRYKYDKGFVKNEKFRDSVWFFSTARRMLSDPVYLGWIVNGKTESHFYSGGDKSEKVPETRWQIVKGMHEPIITEDTYNKVQEMLSENKEQSLNAGKYNTKANLDNILRGKLKCGECGKSMALRYRNSHGKRVAWYVCPMHEHYSSEYCKKKAIKKTELESLVLSFIQNQMKLFIDAKELIRKMNQHSRGKSRYEVYQSQIHSAEKQISHFSKLKVQAYQDYKEKLLTERDYMDVVNDYNEKIDELSIFVSGLKQDAARYKPDYEGSEYWKEIINQYYGKKELSRDMVDAVIDTVTVYNNGRTEILLKSKDEFQHVITQAAEFRSRGESAYAG